ncbi:hypothetical protein Tco_0781548 [Tanacetum coccineum]
MTRSDFDAAQVARDAEVARQLEVKLQAEVEKERQREEQASMDYIANLYDEVQARIDDDHELAVRLTHKEQEKYTVDERAKLLAEFFERRKKQLAEERAAAIRNKPLTRTQLRSLMMTYLKHTGDYFGMILDGYVGVYIMAASAIIISSDSSDESVGSPPSRVILFAISSAAPVVETTLVASPTGLCGLVPYTGSDSDSPDEVSSPEHISPLPATSPFICTDSSETPDSSDGPPSQDPYFPIAPVTAPPGIRRRSATLIRPGEAIPFGRPYRTHPNGPRKLLTARKRVRPLPARRLASRHASPRSPIALPSEERTTRSEEIPSLVGCSTIYCVVPPTTTSESSSGDSSERPMHSSPHSAGPSRKRCRSPVDSVSLSMPVTGSLAPTRADHLPPRKRFRDSYSSEASLEEDAEVGPTETGVDVELGISDGDVVGDRVGIDHRDATDDQRGGLRLTPHWSKSPDGRGSLTCLFSRDGIDRIVGIETAQGRLEADQLIASGDRARMAEAIYSLRLENLKIRAMLDIERDRC